MQPIFIYILFQVAISQYSAIQCTDNCTGEIDFKNFEPQKAHQHCLTCPGESDFEYELQNSWELSMQFRIKGNLNKDSDIFTFTNRNLNNSELLKVKLSFLNKLEIYINTAIGQEPDFLYTRPSLMPGQTYTLRIKVYDVKNKMEIYINDFLEKTVNNKNPISTTKGKFEAIKEVETSTPAKVYIESLKVEKFTDNDDLCLIFYAECNYQGTSTTVCSSDSLNNLNVPHVIGSIRVPDNNTQTFKLYTETNMQGDQLTFAHDQRCLR